jgi:hypothetical protein
MTSGVLIFVVLVVVMMVLGTFVLIAVLIGQGAMRWHRNNQQPIQTLPALVVAKRTSVSGGRNSGAHTSYYATFELQTGERREFRVPASAYGLLAERDQGQLTFQGTRFHGYARGWPPAGPVQQPW